MHALGAEDLRRALLAYRDLLRAHQERLNRLNVYPVPDGDTGTNMALTVESVAAALEDASDMPAVCTAMSHGSLMGARGNSGVILSQILRGLAEVCKAHEAVAGGEVAAALAAAGEAAYAAVMRPVEGTILTVARGAGEGARASLGAGDGASLVAVLDGARAGAQAALDSTPSLLPVLEQAGVVDAGGAGYVLLLDALLHVVDGRELPEAPPAGDEVPAAVTAAPAAEPGVGDLRYEVMYLLEADDEKVPAFKDVWAGLGDSIVVVGGDGIWSCHIHTDDVGASIEAALDCGRPRQIRVTDLREQVEEERWVREAAGATSAAAAADGAPADPVPTAVVAVATGDGVGRIFHSLGVHRIVAGGQSMNPSTAQILEAVEAAPAGEVVVLPNNKNIVPVAQQVDALTAKTVRVVPTRSVAEGFAALLEYDPESTADENLATMAAAAERVVSGEVTRAVRDAETPAGRVSAGDWVGLAGDGIRVVDTDLAGALCRLLDELVGPDHEVVTLIEGEGATPADTRRATEWLAANRPEATAEVHHGGQPLYPYLLSIE